MVINCVIYKDANNYIRFYEASAVQRTFFAILGYSIMKHLQTNYITNYNT